MELEIFGARVTDDCGPVGSVYPHTTLTLPLSDLSTVSYDMSVGATFILSYVPHATAHTNPVRVEDLQCPTWGLQDRPINKTYPYTTLTVGPPFNPIIVPPPQLRKMDSDWAKCRNFGHVGRYGQMIYGFYDPPRMLQAAPVMAPVPSPTIDRAVIVTPSAEPAGARIQEASVRTFAPPKMIKVLHSESALLPRPPNHFAGGQQRDARHPTRTSAQVGESQAEHRALVPKPGITPSEDNHVLRVGSGMHVAAAPNDNDHGAESNPHGSPGSQNVPYQSEGPPNPHETTQVLSPFSGSDPPSSDQESNINHNVGGHTPDENANAGTNTENEDNGSRQSAPQQYQNGVPEGGQSAANRDPQPGAKNNALSPLQDGRNTQQSHAEVNNPGALSQPEHPPGAKPEDQNPSPVEGGAIGKTVVNGITLPYARPGARSTPPGRLEPIAGFGDQFGDPSATFHGNDHMAKGPNINQDFAAASYPANVAEPSPTFNVAGEGFVVNPSGFEVHGMRVIPGGKAAVISGTPVSLGSSGILRVGSKTYNLLSPTMTGAAHPPSGPIIESPNLLSGQGGRGDPIQGTGPSDIGQMQDGLPSPAKLVIGGSRFDLADPAAYPGLKSLEEQKGSISSAALVIGGSTYSLDNPGVFSDLVSIEQQAIEKSPATAALPNHSNLGDGSYFVAGGEVFKANPTGFSVHGTPVRPGGPGVTLDGTSISLAPSGHLIVGSQTVDLLNGPTATTSSSDLGPLIAIGGDVFHANPSGFSIHRTPIRPGGPGMSIDGTSISLAPSGHLIIGSRTIDLLKGPPAITSKPDLNPIFVAGGDVFQANPTGFSIHGTSIRPGGPGVTLDGTSISLAPSGRLIIGSKTVDLLSGISATAPVLTGAVTTSSDLHNHGYDSNNPGGGSGSNSGFPTGVDTPTLTSSSGPGPGPSPATTGTHSKNDAPNFPPRPPLIITLICSFIIMFFGAYLSR